MYGRHDDDDFDLHCDKPWSDGSVLVAIGIAVVLALIVLLVGGR